MYPFLAIAIFFNVYYIVLQIFYYNSFLDFLIGLKSFSTIWLLLAILFYFLFFLCKRGKLKRFGKKTKIVLFSLLSSFSILFFVLFIKIAIPNTTNQIPTVKYVILFGGGVNRDGSLNPSVKKRVEKCAFVMQENKDLLCITSGGKSLWNVYPEGYALKKELCKLGIKESRIIEENYAKDTIQNLKLSANIIAKKEGKTLTQVLDYPIVLVSSGYHLTRIERIAKKLGFTKIYCISAKTPKICILDSYLREAFAHIKLQLRIILTRQPSKLT